jgi:hypothetical protein
VAAGEFISPAALSFLLILLGWWSEVLCLARIIFNLVYNELGLYLQIVRDLPKFNGYMVDKEGKAGR